MKVYDKDIRELLLKKFTQLKEFTDDPTTVVIQELDVCLGYARVDIAVINGKLHGFEIKSEQDTLERLPSQIEAYCSLFDTMTIIVGENHIDKVIQLVPEWWGIYCVIKNKNELSLKRIRQPKINKNIDCLSLAQLLWKEELIELLRKTGITKSLNSKSKFYLRDIVVDKVNAEFLKTYVRNKLKFREGWRAVQLQQLYGG